MLNTLSGLEQLIQEHEVIQANTRSIFELTDNLATLNSLQENSPGFTEYQFKYLSDKRVNLKRALGSLRDGLFSHYIREEEIMQPLVGIPLMQAIKKVHQDTLEKLTEIDWVLLNIGPLGVLFNSDYLKQKIDTLCQILNVSCNKENTILELLKQ